MGDLYKLQYISLCSKITQELENHIGLRDKVLAEFLITLATNSTSEKDFLSQLEENEANFSPQFSSSLYILIQKMLPSSSNISLNQNVPKKLDQIFSKKDTYAPPDHQTFEDLEHKEATDKKLIGNKFPALVIPNGVNQEEIELDLSPKKNPEAEESKMIPEPEPEKKRKSISADSHHNKQKKRSRSREKSERKDKKDKKERKDKKSKKDKDKEKDRKDGKDFSKDHYSKNDHHHRKKSESEPLKEVEIGKVYDGRVTKVHDYGCFVLLTGFHPKKEGLVHISNIREQRVVNSFEAVQRNQIVKVKVIGIVATKISLSMKEIDQKTGLPIEKKLLKTNNESKTETNEKKAPFGLLTGIKIDSETKEQTIKRTKKRMTSPELWEESRLKYFEKTNFIEKPDPNSENEVSDEDVMEIEMANEEAPFLRGQTTKGGMILSPVKIIQNPDGTLQREALNALQYARDRREMREQQQRALLENMPKDFSKYWDDPSAAPGTRNLATSLKTLGQQAFELPEWKKDTFKKNYPFAIRSTMSIKDQRESLPIYQFKNDLIKAVAQNKILVVIGETGSGKTTQITQYLSDAGFIKKGKKIGCTQPRRVAAISVAKRVSEEMGVVLGEEVGYSIRFDDLTSNNTVIKYMTDGMLLREALVDKDLLGYSVIMLDEAHERTIHTDVLFGLLKLTAEKRDDFRLIVTSATLDAEKFSSYFYNCKIFRIPGRTFPVEILYTKEPESDYLDAALTTVMQIHLVEPAGDILLFLTGQEEIDTACQILYERMKKLGEEAPELIILPVYSALPSEMQTKIFEPAPPGSRKCVIATNIAEASLTIDGIFYVVDPGFAKIKVFNPKLGMDTLVVAPISQASAKQRAGRAGRTGPGKCYRLYTEEAYKSEMLPVTVPEIQRTNLSNTVLLLKAMGINDLLNFDFMDPPPIQSLICALESLYGLGALDEEGLLTRLGRKMAEFPLEPPLSKMLLTAVDLGCVEEIITIVAMLSVQNVFYRPKDKQSLSDQKRSKFHQPEGDHLTLLTVYESWKQNNFSNVWCHDNFIQARSMRRAQDVKKQLISIMDKYKYDVKSCGQDYAKVRKAITAGFFAHACKRDANEGYRTIIDNQQVHIHPSSALFNKSPEWVVYHELVLTSKEYMREVCAIDPKWLIEVAPKFFKISDMNSLSKRKRMERLEPLSSKHEDKDAWRLSRRKG